ncbi:hypothetical protein DRP04_02855 [Archaeoglobales archaeon]|nr:MAG: hypothetical protein DRP04_02855 [Archaeoglobales archaeon]
MEEREVARRIFAFEVNSCRQMVKEGEKTYAITENGLRVNRIFFVGALLEKTEVRPGVWKLRIADPTGSIRAYVSNYQPEALEAVMDIEPPCLVGVTGKVRVIDLNGKIIPIVRVETINVVDKTTYTHWLREALSFAQERKLSVERVEEVLREEEEEDFKCLEFDFTKYMS